ncbi:MAG: elongation factor G [Actinobacteria bacterium]|nr:elongation factor G [Actinomycetota bacterium]
MVGIASGNKKVVGIVSGNGSGKTSLAECFLFNSGAVNRLGKIEAKNTVSDYSPLEIKKGFSISSSMMHYSWKNHEINMIDCPGYMDFTAQALSTINVSDGVLLVIDVKSGLQAATEKIIEYFKNNVRPAFCVINKLDQENVNFLSTVNDLKGATGLNLVPITIPLSEGEKFSSIIDLLQNKQFNYSGNSFQGQKADVDGAKKDEVEGLHNSLIESIVETNDELLNKYLEGEKIDASSINSIFKAAVIDCKVIPVFAVSSGKNYGVDILMDYINTLMPSPLETKPLKVKDAGKDTEAEIKPSPDGPAFAYVFKTTADPYIGKMSIFRVFSGTIKAGSAYHISGSKNTHKFTNLFKLQGKEQTDVSEATCGDIVAVSKILDISNDDTISAPDKPLVMEQITYPQPTLPRAILPVSKGDEEKISMGIAKLVEEDPTLKTELNIEVHQNIVWGMGDLHLSIVKENLKEKFDIDVTMTAPDVAYKETIKKDAKAEYKYKKQSGGRGQYGHVFIEIKPLKSGENFKFEDSIFGGAIPKNYIPSVEKGVKEAMISGILAGYPVVNVYVNLYDGSFHTVDSSDMAFKIAASMAFKKGMAESGPVILEPVMELEVIVPEKYMGDIIGDINSKRGKIITMTPSENKMQIIKASIPQSESFNYSMDLKSITQGRGNFSLKFSHYDELPAHLAQPLIDKKKEEKDKE